MEKDFFDNLADEASKAGICKEWEVLIRESKSLSFVCNLFFKGSDWSMANNFPSVELVKPMKAEVKKFGLIINDKEDSNNVKNNNIALIGNSFFTAVFSGYDVKDLYVRDSSVLNISASDNVIINVTATGKSVLILKAVNNAVINVYCEGSVLIIPDGNINVNKKEK